MFETKQKIKYFTGMELKTFFNALEKERIRWNFSKHTNSYKYAVRNEALYKIMYYCALRATEVTVIPFDYYNDLKHEIHCERLKNGKNNTLAIVDEEILQSLERHLRVNNPKEYLFENINNTDNKMISRKTIYSNMKKICNEVGMRNLDKCHPHTLRHTRAIDLLESGATIYDVQYWLGHADVTNTQIYLAFTSKQQERLYQLLRVTS